MGNSVAVAFTGPIEDRLAIRELMDGYASAVTQRDEEAWASLWAEDSRWLLRTRAGMDGVTDAGEPLLDNRDNFVMAPDRSASVQQIVRDFGSQLVPLS